MNPIALSHIEYLLDPYKSNFSKTLIEEGVVLSDGKVNQDKINLMAGAAASPLFDQIGETDLDINEFYGYFRSLVEAEEYKAAYLFLLTLYEALEMELPYLFLALSGDKTATALFVIEFEQDLTECIDDYNSNQYP